MQPDIQVYDSMAAFYAGTMGKALQADVQVTVHRLEQVHPNAPYQSPRFRANYYSVVLIRQGRGHYLLDQQRYPIQPSTIYFTNPGHVKGFEMDEISEGFILTFAETFLKRSVHEHLLAAFPFLIAETAPPFYATPEQFAAFHELGEQLHREYTSPSRYRLRVVGSLLTVLLLKFREAFWDAYDPRQEGEMGSPIVRLFKQHLEAHLRDLLAGRQTDRYRVQDFAAAQHLHPNYLSNVIKAKTGRPVNDWIADQVVAEAQTLLTLPGQSVQEVAYRLGFKDPGHFSRYFKKKTGLSPTDFQHQNL